MNTSSPYQASVRQVMVVKQRGTLLSTKSDRNLLEDVQGFVSAS